MYGRKISFNNKNKYDGLRGPYVLPNNLLQRYLNFCEGILSSLVDSFLVVNSTFFSGRYPYGHVQGGESRMVALAPFLIIKKKCIWFLKKENEKEAQMYFVGCVKLRINYTNESTVILPLPIKSVRINKHTNN